MHRRSHALNALAPTLLAAGLLVGACATPPAILIEAETAIAPQSAAATAATATAATATAATAPAATTAAPATPRVFTPPSGALLLEGRLGEAYKGSFSSSAADLFLDYAVSPGTTYELFVVDGYNNDRNAGMKLDSPAKAVGWWLLAPDRLTSLPKAAYLEYEKDSKSSHGYIGLTPEDRAGPVGRFTADSDKVVVHVQRYKAAYVGDFLVLLAERR